MHLHFKKHTISIPKYIIAIFISFAFVLSFQSSPAYATSSVKVIINVKDQTTAPKPVDVHLVTYKAGQAERIVKATVQKDTGGAWFLVADFDGLVPANQYSVYVGDGKDPSTTSGKFQGATGGWLPQVTLTVDGATITSIGNKESDCVETVFFGCVTKKSNDITGSGVWKILTKALEYMTMGIGMLAVGGVIYGSILYASAGGNIDQVKRAKKIIIDVVIGIIAYGLMFSFLNFLIPGGIFQ